MGVITSLAQHIKITSALDYASGTATREGAIIDMLGYRGIIMVVHLAAIAGSAVVGFKAQQDTVVGFTGAADLLGSNQVPADNDDNQLMGLEIWEPTERFLRLVITKDGAYACAESAVYYQYGAINRPTTLAVANLVTFKRLQSPAEGTA